MNVAPISSARDCFPVKRRDLSSGVRKSPWPEVWEIIAPDGHTRGPLACPASMAALSGKIGPPISRTEVKPRISISPAEVSAARA